MAPAQQPAPKPQDTIPEPIRETIERTATALAQASQAQGRKSAVQEELLLVDNTMRVRKIKTRDGWHDLDAKPEFRAKFQELEDAELKERQAHFSKLLEEKYRAMGNDGAKFEQHAQDVVKGAEQIALKSEMETNFAMRDKLRKDEEHKLLSKEEKKRPEYDFSRFTDDLRKRAEDFKKRYEKEDAPAKKKEAPKKTASLDEQVAGERLRLAAFDVARPVEATPQGMQIIGQRQAGIPGLLAA